MTIARQLAEFVADLRYESLPQSAVLAVKRLLLDTIGCALGALDARPVQLLRAAYPAAGPATLIGGGTATAEGAAAVNGAAVRYLDFMDVYWSRDVCHPAENIPPALACVQEAGGSGRDLIAAIVAGYEVQIRLCDAFSFQRLGFHHVSAAGFVVPFVAGKAWRQTPEVMAHGSVLGGTRHLTLGALSKGKLSMAKAIGYPMNAAESIAMARLAAAGMTGPLSAYEWLMQKAGGIASDAAPIALDLDAYRLERVSLKQFPIQYALQAPVGAALQLSPKLRGRGSDVRRVVAMVRPETLERTADPAKFHPADRETADHSLPACVAMALLDGRLGVSQFAGGRFADADVAALIAKTEAVAGPGFDERFPTGRPGGVRIEWTDGTSDEAIEEVPAGDVDHPLDEHALHGKFLALAEPVLGSAKAKRVLDRITAIEQEPGLDALMSDLVP